MLENCVENKRFTEVGEGQDRWLHQVVQQFLKQKLMVFCPINGLIGWDSCAFFFESLLPELGCHPLVHRQWLS